MVSVSAAGGGDVWVRDELKKTGVRDFADICFFFNTIILLFDCLF
jgi:hypothetical protein